MPQVTTNTHTFGKIHILIDNQLQLLTKQVDVDIDSGTNAVESLELGVVGPSIGSQKTMLNFTSSVPRDGFEFAAGQNGLKIGNGEFHNFQFVLGTATFSCTGWLKSMNVSQSTNDAISAKFQIQGVGNPNWVTINPL